MNEQNKPVFDVFLLSFTKDYNNKVINKYGIKALFDGINEIANHYGAENYLKMVSNPNLGFEIPKGYMSEQNRKKVFEYAKNLKSNKGSGILSSITNTLNKLSRVPSMDAIPFFGIARQYANILNR